MIGLRLSLAEAFLYVMWDGVRRIRGNGTSEKDKVTYAFALGIWDGNFCWRTVVQLDICTARESPSSPMERAWSGWRIKGIRVYGAEEG
jgi:hypothetical protein